MRRLLVICSIAALTLAACSSDGGNGSADGSTSPDGSSVVRTTAVGDTTIAPTTTFVPDCTLMPRPGDLSQLVGIPLGEGQVVGSGTCQYLGLNDQSKSLTLALLSDPVDQAAWNDLQASLGTPTPYTDPALPGALVGADSTLYLTANGAVYTVLTQVTGGAAAEQLPQSAAVLTFWLKL